MAHHSLPAHRQQQILSALARDGSVTVSELSRSLGITETTVRRDINQLADQGALIRVHGGAITAPTPRPVREVGRVAPTVQLVIPTDEFHWGAILAAVRTAARTAGIGLRVHRDDMLTPGLLTSLGHEEPDGWLLAPPLHGTGREAVDQWLDRCASPVVLLEREPTPGVGCGIQSVVNDHIAAAASVVRHLAGLGHRRIAVMVPTGGPRSEEYVQGWRQALAWLDLPLLPVLPSIDIIDPARSELAREVVETIRQSAPTAVLVVSDPHAMVLVQICQEAGISVPDDLSVVAFGDYMATWGALTAFRPAYETLGATAVRLLLTRLRGGSVPPGQHVRLEGALMVRETMAAPRRSEQSLGEAAPETG